MRSAILSNSQTVPLLGQGTWLMGEGRHPREQEIRALREGVELGMSLIDTAEIYGQGAVEELVGEAIAGIRDKVFLVSKACPHNAGKDRLAETCEASLRRLATDHLDMYLLHWRGEVDLTETVAGMDALIRAGKIRHWGVSNFSVAHMSELDAAGNRSCSTNQILYNLAERDAERELLPLLDASGLVTMAYSPIGQGVLLSNPHLKAIAADLELTPAQLALAWVLSRDNMVAIPKGGSIQHVRDNRAAADVRLDEETLARLDTAFPAHSESHALL